MASRNISFTPQAWEEYLSWEKENPTVLKKIHTLLKEISREDPYTGTGKPEQLKHALSGAWSRRISREHRLVYQVTETQIVVVQLKYHY